MQVVHLTIGGGEQLDFGSKPGASPADVVEERRQLDPGHDGGHGDRRERRRTTYGDRRGPSLCCPSGDAFGPEGSPGPALAARERRAPQGEAAGRASADRAQAAFFQEPVRDVEFFERVLQRLISETPPRPSEPEGFHTVWGLRRKLQPAPARQVGDPTQSGEEAAVPLQPGSIYPRSERCAATPLRCRALHTSFGSSRLSTIRVFDPRDLYAVTGENSESILEASFFVELTKRAS